MSDHFTTLRSKGLMSAKLFDVPTSIYLLKVNKGSTRIMSGFCSKLAMITTNKQRTNKIVYDRSKERKTSVYCLHSFLRNLPEQRVSKIRKFRRKIQLKIKCFERLSIRSAKVFQMYNFYPIKTQQCPQPAISCSKLTIQTLEQGVKYVQS